MTTTLPPTTLSPAQAPTAAVPTNRNSVKRTWAEIFPESFGGSVGKKGKQ